MRVNIIKIAHSKNISFDNLSFIVLVYLCIIKGITESPAVIYVTAIYPYVVLVIFFIRALTLPGMEDGIAYLFTPKVS